MRMVYTNENRFIVGNAKNILEINGLDVVLRNEHASSVIGEVSAFDSWVELWVLKDTDYDRACEIIETSLSKVGAQEWVCTLCNEENDVSFEVCWNCQAEKP